MKTETVNIGDTVYTITEMNLEQGLQVMNVKTGEPDIGKIVSMSVTVDGKPVKLTDISLHDGVKLIPHLMRINGLEAPAEGNG